MSSPPPNQFPVTNIPTICWSAVPGSGSVGFQNTDETAEMYLSQSSSVQPGDQNSIPLDPLGFMTLASNVTWYAVSAGAPTGPLLVMPGATDFSAGAASIAQAMIDVGVATAIAQAIAGEGVSIVAAPTLLYSISAVPPSVSGALVGGSIPSNSYQATCYNSDIPGQFDVGDQRFITAVGRASANGNLQVTKKFWNVSEWGTNVTRNNMASYAAKGTKVIVCLQPVITFGLPAGSDFTLVGTTAQKNAAIADKASLAAMLAAGPNSLGNLGFTANTAWIVLWQEPGNGSKNVSPTDFGNMLKTYGPTVNASIYPLWINVNYTGAIHRATDYANAAFGRHGNPATGATVVGIAMDWYTNSYTNGLMLTSTDANNESILGIAHTLGVPFALNEVGCKVGGGVTTAQCQQYMADDAVNSVEAVMQGEIQAGRSIGDVIYFDGLCSADGTGDIASPIGQAPNIPAPDFRIPYFQKWFDTLQSTPSSPFTIPANSTVTITPVTPSPVGGLALTDQLSYEIALQLSAGAGSTNPFVSLTFLWYDFDQVPRDQNPIYKEVWHVPMGTNADPNGPLTVYGGGRMHGSYLQVKINNQDSVTCTVASLQMSGVSRIGARSSITWNPNAAVSPNVPTFTLAAAADQTLQLGREELQNVPAGNTKGWLCGLWGGQIFFRALVSGAAANGDVHVQVQPQPTGVFGTENILNEGMGIAGGGNDERVFTISSPRCPLQVVVNNNDANAITVSFQMIAIETA